MEIKALQTGAGEGQAAQSRRQCMSRVIRRLASIATVKSPFRTAMPEEFRAWHAKIQNLGRRLARHMEAKGKLDEDDTMDIERWLMYLKVEEERLAN